MVYRISNIIVDFLERNNVLNEEKEIYLYGARLFVSMLISSIILVIIGIAYDRLFEVIIYEIIMTISRVVLGGYHCKHYASCILSYVVLFVSGLIINELNTFGAIDIFVIMMCGSFLIIKYCPVENINKELSIEKKRRFKKYSNLFLAAYMFACFLQYINNINMNWLFCVFVIIQILIAGGEIDYERAKK